MGRAISSLVKVHSKPKAFAPVPAWTWVSVHGVCALCTGASKDTGFTLAVTDFRLREAFIFFFFGTTSFSSCGSQMFIWHSEKIMQKEEFVKSYYHATMSWFPYLMPKEEKKCLKLWVDFQHLHN